MNTHTRVKCRARSYSSQDSLYSYIIRRSYSGRILASREHDASENQIHSFYTTYLIMSLMLQSRAEYAAKPLTRYRWIICSAERGFSALLSPHNTSYSDSAFDLSALVSTCTRRKIRLKTKTIVCIKISRKHILETFRHQNRINLRLS